jgi:hypothetical protein
VIGVRIQGGKAQKPDLGGGAIRVGERASLTVLRSVLDSNDASSSKPGETNSGGALDIVPLGSARLTDVTLSHNVAYEGAGIYSEGDLQLTNVTIGGNNASAFAGALFVHPPTGAQKLTERLLHVTIAGNTGPTANATAILINDSQQVVSVISASSIVAGTCSGELQSILSSGANVFTDTTCGKLAGSDDRVASDPGLGGLTTDPSGYPVFPLLPGSPAIDLAANHDFCPLLDERGVKRPQGAGCDSGAYELATQ